MMLCVIERWSESVFMCSVCIDTAEVDVEETPRSIWSHRDNGHVFPSASAAHTWSLLTFSSGCCDGCEQGTICTPLELRQDGRARGQKTDSARGQDTAAHQGAEQEHTQTFGGHKKTQPWCTKYLVKFPLIFFNSILTVKNSDFVLSKHKVNTLSLSQLDSL